MKGKERQGGEVQKGRKSKGPGSGDQMENGASRQHALAGGLSPSVDMVAEVKEVQLLATILRRNVSKTKFKFFQDSRIMIMKEAC